MNTVYPWQQAIWQILVQSRARQTLPHAFIFSGVQVLVCLNLAK